MSVDKPKDLEEKLALSMEGADFPYFVRQYKLIRSRQFRWDFYFPAYHVLVEVQGGIWFKGKSAHSTGAGIRRDAIKGNLALMQGAVTVLITPEMVKQKNGEEALFYISEVLKKRGWNRDVKV